MPARKKTPRNRFALVRGGALGLALEDHALQRFDHFFRHLFFIKAACEKARSAGVKVSAHSTIQEAATHQVDTGRRSGRYSKFDNTDADMVDENAQNFKSIDAAHFSNFGFTSEWNKVARIDQPDIKEMVASAQVLAGDTQLLPQAVNLGPDRVIDRLHFELAKKFLNSDHAILSKEHVEIYRKMALSRLGAYKTKMKVRGHLALARCANSYIVAYDQTRFKKMTKIAYNAIEAEASFYKLDPKDDKGNLIGKKSSLYINTENLF